VDDLRLLLFAARHRLACLDLNLLYPIVILSEVHLRLIGPCQVSRRLIEGSLGVLKGLLVQAHVRLPRFQVTATPGVLATCSTFYVALLRLVLLQLLEVVARVDMLEGQLGHVR